jgi:hypothetical protein
MSAAVNVGVASWLYANNSMWFINGLAGIVVGVVWNYTMLHYSRGIESRISIPGLGGHT